MPIAKKNRLTQKLQRVYWLGGSPCSGKSSVADLLHERYGIAVYPIDDALREHYGPFNPRTQPCLYRWTNPDKSPTFWDDIWMRPVDDLLAEVFHCYEETFDLVLSDILLNHTDSFVLVEGNCLTPSTIAPILSNSSHALWMAPTEEFQRTMYAQRAEWVQQILSQYSDPDQAMQDWMDRDVAFAAQIVLEARENGYELLTVSDQRSIEQNANLVAMHFGLTR